jgi:acyl-CoA reductase-like NAD-dependent aldehyde dehydrogenase
MTTILSPITAEVIAEVPGVDATRVGEAFVRAEEAFRSWRRVPASERGRLLVEVGRRVRERGEEIAELETLNTGKLLKDTRREVERAAGCFEYFGGYADKVTGTTIPVPGEFHTYTEREPHGVAVGIIPWNVPYIFAAKKIAPALAFGNVSILKPAEETPLSALRLAEVMEEVGIPNGVAQVITGGGEVGRLLVEDPRADLIVFTGSDRTGKAIAHAAAENLTPIALELGGKSPQMVFGDADLEAALRGVLVGVFSACGQMCLAGSRLFVEETVYDGFMERLAEAVRGLRVGDPREGETQIGPQVTRAQRDKTLSMLEAGVEEGAEVMAQARTPDDPRLEEGFFVPPTVFGEVQPEMTIMREEIFGPVLAVSRFKDEEDAVRLAHQTDFGLAAGIWTNDVGRAHRVAREIDAGHIWINTYRIVSDLVPFGGIGRSGYGREGGTDAVNLYTRTKSVWTSLTPGLLPAFQL